MGAALKASWGSPLSYMQGYLQSDAVVNTTLDADGEYIATVFSMPGTAGSTDTPTHIGYRQGTTTGTPAASSYDIGVMALDASANPDGTFIFSTAITPVTGDDGKFIWVAVTGSALTAGTAYALVLKANANLTASNNISATPILSFGSGFRGGMPYAVTNTGAAAKTGAGLPAMAWKSASQTWGYPASNLKTGNAYGGTTVESGFTFTIPTNFCSTYKVAGIRWIDTMTGTVADTYVMSLYSSPQGTPSLLNQTALQDADITAVVSSAHRQMELMFDGTLDTLDAGTEYCIALAKDDTGEGGLYTVTVETAADLDGWQYGQQLAFASRNPAAYPPATGTPAFTVTTTKRVWAELILADITAPAGGSGGGRLIAGSLAG